MRKLRFLVIVLALLLSISLAGCKKTYVFDFIAKQSLGEAPEYWELNGVENLDYEILPGGLRLYGGEMMSSIAVGGDFSVEFDFDLINADINTITFLNFYLGDGYLNKSGIFMVEKFMGLSFTKPGSTEEECYYGQGAEWFDITSLTSALKLNGANKVKLTKTGSNMKIHLNSKKMGDYEILPSNMLSFYRIYAMSRYIGSEDAAGMLFRKVTIKYQEGMLSFIPFATPD